MNKFNTVLRGDERVALELRALYGSRGYSQFKMSKFEEYDLYVRNKDFLISDSVITFTNPDGKLMALKPDVTLSIIKNTADDASQCNKLYYNENVYRAAKGSRSFKEIMQVGLECIGNVDELCLCEVLQLAAESLKLISDECVLDISHLDIVSKLLSSLEIPEEYSAAVLKCIGDKNPYELTAVCREAGITPEKITPLKELTSLYGAPADVLPRLEKICPASANDSLAELSRVCAALEGYGDIVRIDFSVMNDMNYYNGIVFKGFLSGIPTGVLSGGQYDKLMQKMGRKARALGFAVYLDLLQRIDENVAETDFDALLLYSAQDPADKVFAAAESLRKQGKSVMLQQQKPSQQSFAEIYKFSEKGATLIENA